MALDCSRCVWKHPDTCRACRAEQKELEVAQQVAQVKQVDVWDWYELPSNFEIFVN